MWYLLGLLYPPGVGTVALVLVSSARATMQKRRDAVGGHLYAVAAPSLTTAISVVVAAGESLPTAAVLAMTIGRGMGAQVTRLAHGRCAARCPAYSSRASCRR